MGPEDPGRKRGFPFADFEFLLSPGTEDLRPSPQSRAATRAAMRPSGGRKTRARLSIRDALEPVEEIARAHLAVDTKTHPVRKRAIRFEKNASVIIPDVSAFVGLFVVFVFGLLGGSARSHVQEKQQRERDRLVTNGLHARGSSQQMVGA